LPKLFNHTRRDVFFPQKDGLMGEALTSGSVTPQRRGDRTLLAEVVLPTSLLAQSFCVMMPCRQDRCGVGAEKQGRWPRDRKSLARPSSIVVY